MSIRKLGIFIFGIVIGAGVILSGSQIISIASGGVDIDLESGSSPDSDRGDQVGAGLRDSYESEDINSSATESEFLEIYNQERANRSLAEVDTAPVLSEMAKDQTDYILENKHFEHTREDGTTIEDRFQDRGLLPQCKIQKGARSYYPGAENLAQTYVFEDVIEPDGVGSKYIRTNEELARYIFDQWMWSQGHREAMLQEDIHSIGLAVSITEENKVYASLEMCGEGL